jgi:predicted nucleic acid-binding protein
MNAAEAFFTDTNLLLYSVGAAHPGKNRLARLWVGTLWATGAGRLSYQVLHEFYANAIRKLGVAIPVARENVLLWNAWQPVDTSLALIQRGWHWMDTAQLTYRDALIVSAAELSGCRWLLTEDLQDGRTYDTVTVVNPFRVSPEEFGLTIPHRDS